MTSVEALRALNAADNEARTQFSYYVTSASSIGQQTVQAANKTKNIITAALIGGFCLLGLIFILIGGWMILFGFLFIGLGIFIGVMYNKSVSEKIAKIITDRQNLENSINQNSTY